MPRAWLIPVAMLGACSSGSSQLLLPVEEGDVVVAARMQEGGEIVPIGIGLAPVSFDTSLDESVESLVVALLSRSDLIDESGEALSDREIETLELVSKNDAGGCGRCLAPVDQAPQVLHDGDACPVPIFARFFQKESSIEPTSDIAKAIRSQLRIARGGECACDRVVDFDTGHDFEIELVSHQEPHDVQTFVTAPNGTVGLFSDREIQMILPDGTEISREVTLPGDVPRAVGLPDGRFVFTSEIDDRGIGGFTESTKLYLVDERLEPTELSIDRPVGRITAMISSSQGQVMLATKPKNLSIGIANSQILGCELVDQSLECTDWPDLPRAQQEGRLIVQVGPTRFFSPTIDGDFAVFDSADPDFLISGRLPGLGGSSGTCAGTFGGRLWFTRDAPTPKIFSADLADAPPGVFHENGFREEADGRQNPCVSFQPLGDGTGLRLIYGDNRNLVLRGGEEPVLESSATSYGMAEGVRSAQAVTATSTLVRTWSNALYLTGADPEPRLLFGPPIGTILFEAVVPFESGFLGVGYQAGTGRRQLYRIPDSGAPELVGDDIASNGWITGAGIDEDGLILLAVRHAGAPDEFVFLHPDGSTPELGPSLSGDALHGGGLPTWIVTVGPGQFMATNGGHLFSIRPGVIEDFGAEILATPEEGPGSRPIVSSTLSGAWTVAGRVLRTGPSTLRAEPIEPASEMGGLGVLGVKAVCPDQFWAFSSGTDAEQGSFSNVVVEVSADGPGYLAIAEPLEHPDPNPRRSSWVPLTLGVLGRNPALAVLGIGALVDRFGEGRLQLLGGTTYARLPITPVRAVFNKSNASFVVLLEGGWLVRGRIL